MAENYYQILDVGIRATQDEIKSAYKKQALKFHPDVNQGSKIYEEKFKQVLEAYQTLSDPSKKDLYDLKLFYKSFHHGAGSSNSGNHSPGTPKTRREREKEEYQRRRPEREAYREYKGPPFKERVTVHSAALTLLVLGTVVILFLWLGDLMNHWTAKEHLEQGDFATALQFDDEFSEAYFARFQYRKKFVQNIPVLISDLHKAIRFSDEPKAEWFIERARLYFKMDSINQCKDDFLMAKTLNPTSDTAFYALGEIYAFYIHDPKKALTYYDSTLQVNKDFYPALFGKAYMLYRLKRFPQAISAFNACMKYESNDKRLYFYRGSISLAVGDSISACTDLDQSLTMGMEEAKPLVDSYCSKTRIQSQP